MADKFQNKYRIPSARLPGWDYGTNAAYFVTICTKNRDCFFGDIIETQNIASQNNGETHNYASLQPPMKFSPIGQIAHSYWQEIPQHFPFVKLGEFVVMPNHVHGIIIIDKPVETQNFASLQSSSTNAFAPQSKNLASIIRGYKSAVTKYATINHIKFAWQPRFHDHIIRDNESFHRISQYIINNPLNWVNDEWHTPL